MIGSKSRKKVYRKANNYISPKHSSEEKYSTTQLFTHVERDYN